MAIKKYINTGELAGLTGCLDEDIRELAKKGVLPAHKTRRGHWRFNVDAAERFFGIVINPITDLDEDDGEDLISEVEPLESVKLEAVGDGETRFIFNSSHYDEALLRICDAKSSIKIMTANFKRFRLKPTVEQGINYTDGTPFIEFLMRKAVQGVSVQIVCSQPSKPFLEEWSECFRKMNMPKLFECKMNDRNHAKIYIIDDKIAYIGSANVTRAGLRQTSLQNFEAGILTENNDMLSSVKKYFSMVWNDNSSNPFSI